MKLIIDIPDEEYKRLTYIDILKLRRYIENGTPLPKGHGRLIDVKNLQNFVSRYTEYDAVQLILADREDYIPTIIEADKVESEGEE